MSFFGDVLKGILEADDNAPFGSRLRKDDRAFYDFYERVQFDFGLVPRYQLRDNQHVPVRVNTGWDGKMYSFEIHGNIYHPMSFFGRGGIFDKISRDVPVAPGRVWAFDITRLDVGILSGQAVAATDVMAMQSDQALRVLNIVGSAVAKPVSSVPAIGLRCETIWERYGIPDEISFRVESIYPFSKDELVRIVNLITHNFRNHNAPVKFSYQGVVSEGRMVIVVTEKTPEAPPAPTEAPTAAPKSFDEHLPVPPKVEPAEGDEFPYDFYRGLGLIDDENLVAVPSILGPIRIPMITEQAKEFLLAYKPENQ